MSKILIFFLFILCSCVEDKMTPEGALEAMTEARMGKVVTRKDILVRVTGRMKASVENMTDEDFDKFSDLKNIEKDSFKILSKSCQEKKCFVTYSIAYKTKEDKKTHFTSEVKKIAEIINIEGKWLISDVSNIKTYHEAFETINP